MSLPAIMSGCATEPDCAGAMETAEMAARGRQPLAQWRPTVDAACADQAERAWADALAEDCAPLYGFHLGHTGRQTHDGCEDAEFQSAWNLGQMLAELQAEADEIEARLEEGSLPADTRRDLKRRQVVIGRDLPQLEALARMDGYLPPADVPDAE